MKPKTRKPEAEVKVFTLGIRCESALVARLKAIARREDMTLTQVARKAIREYLERKAA